LRLLPKPYLVVKETLVREYARRGGKLRRREARDLVKIDVNKLSRVWDFLVQSGYLKITNEQSAVTAPSTASSASQPQGNGGFGTTSVNGSPQKEAPAQISPRVPMPPSMSMSSASSSQNGSLYSASLQLVPQLWSTSN